MVASFSLFSEAASFYVHSAKGHKNVGRLKGGIAAFRAAPSGETAWNLGGDIVGVIGTPRIYGQLVKYTIKLAQKVAASDDQAGKDMVERMRSRVPVDTGTLLNGITYENDDGAITVEASAIRGDVDYARYVEFGTKGGSSGSVADESFFANGANAGAALRSSGGGGGKPAEPFFWNSAQEVLADRGKKLEDVSDQAAAEEGLR